MMALALEAFSLVKLLAQPLRPVVRIAARGRYWVVRRSSRRRSGFSFEVRSYCRCHLSLRPVPGPQSTITSFKMSRLSRARPAPRATVARGSSAILMGRPVSCFSRRPTLHKGAAAGQIDPRSTMSAANSGGVCSGAVFTAATMLSICSWMGAYLVGIDGDDLGDAGDQVPAFDVHGFRSPG